MIAEAPSFNVTDYILLCSGTEMDGALVNTKLQRSDQAP